MAKKKVEELANFHNASKATLAQQAASYNSNATMTNRIISAVGKNIIVNSNTNSNTFAVIIGNENYKGEASVPYAENNARIFKEYVRKTLGVPEKQIKYISTASLNDLRISIRWLKQAMQVSNGKGKAIFYYAGHVIPDEDDKSAYLSLISGAV